VALGQEDLRLGKCYVNSSCVEDRATRDKHNLHHESPKVEGIVIHDNPSDISNNLKQTPNHHEAHVEPLLPLDAQNEMCPHGDGVEDDEGDVGGERRAVFVDAPFYGAEIEIAVCVGAKDDQVVW